MRTETHSSDASVNVSFLSHRTRRPRSHTIYAHKLSFKFTFQPNGQTTVQIILSLEKTPILNQCEAERTSHTHFFPALALSSPSTLRATDTSLPTPGRSTSAEP